MADISSQGVVGMLYLRLWLEGCQSLKEKRQRLRGIRDRLGKHPQIALMECANEDRWQVSEWQFLLLAQHKSHVERLASQVEEHILSSVDAVITERDWQWL